VLRLISRPKWSIEDRREKNSEIIAEEVDRSEETSQALLEHDILLKELQEKYQETEEVCEHLLNHYLISEYVQLHRILRHDIATIKDSKRLFQLKLEELMDYRKSIKQQDIAITTRSVEGSMEPELRLALNKNLVTLLTIDNEVLDLRVMYQYLIQNCKNT
jgi:hypothetical protein